MLLAWLMIVSVALSVDPGVSARRFVLSFATFLLAAMLPWLTKGLKHFTTLMLGTAALVWCCPISASCWCPIWRFTRRTISSEPEIAGDWRGIYSHKNGAASLMAVLVYVGWFLARRERPAQAVAMISIAAFVFLIYSAARARSEWSWWSAVIAFFVDRARSLPGRALVAFGAARPSSAFSRSAPSSARRRARFWARSRSTLTFTGRTEIWSFAIDALAAHPWKGQGFEAFWYSDSVRFGAEDSSKWMVDCRHQPQ